MRVFATFTAEGMPTGYWPQDGVGPPPPDGATEITVAQWREFCDNQGLRRWDRGRSAVVVHAPPASPLAEPTVTGNQWAFALGDLGLAAAWRKGVAQSKDKDQIRWGLVSRFDRLVAADPLLARIAANANAGKDAADPTWIDPAAVFARAFTEPT